MTCQVQHMGWRARKRRRLSEQGRYWANCRWKKEKVERLRNPPEIDPETARRRALYDAKGKLLFAGISPTLGRVDIYRSTHRHDQLDVFVNGAKVSTGGPRVLAAWIKSLPITNEPNERPPCQKPSH